MNKQLNSKLVNRLVPWIEVKPEADLSSMKPFQHLLDYCVLRHKKSSRKEGPYREEEGFLKLLLPSFLPYTPFPPVLSNYTPHSTKYKNLVNHKQILCKVDTCQSPTILLTHPN